MLTFLAAILKWLLTTAVRKHRTPESRSLVGGVGGAVGFFGVCSWASKGFELKGQTEYLRVTVSACTMSQRAEEDAFMHPFGEQYEYAGQIDQIRTQEFKRLEGIINCSVCIAK